MSDSVDADLTSQFGSEDLEGSLPDSASEIAAVNDVAPLSVACQSSAPAATPQSPSQALSPDTHSPVCVSATERHNFLSDVLQDEFMVFAILPIGPGDGENSLVLSIKTAALRKVLLDYRWVNRTNLVAVATFSPHEGALLASGFSKAAATTAAPWMRLLSAACEKTPTSTGPSTIWATCRYTFERQCHQTDIAEMEPHPTFVSAIEDAVGADDADPPVQLSALRRVLAAWGPVYATRLTMGCALGTSVSSGWTLTEVRVYIFSVGFPCSPSAVTAAQRGGSSVGGRE
jgi:hypothetical protein